MKARKNLGKLLFLCTMLVLLVLAIAVPVMAAPPLLMRGQAIPPASLEANFLAGVAGFLVSLAFAYLPGVKVWFEDLPTEYKRGVMVLSLLLAVVIVVGANCLGFLEGNVCPAPFTWLVLVPIIKAFFVAAIANQGTFLLTTASNPNRIV